MTRADAAIIGASPHTAKGALILLYHRITQLATDPQLLAVHPARFQQHLEILQRHATVIPLQQLARDIRDNRLRPATVCITFDDGYRDNLLEAAPLLRQAGLPATVFATTAHSEDGQEFFWDGLDRIFLQPGTLPPHLSLEIAGAPFICDLAEFGYAPELWRERRWWNVELPSPPPDPGAPLSRQELYRALCGRLHRCTIEQRQSALAQLRAWACAGDSGRLSHRLMTPAQLQELAADGLIDVGAHTVHHPLLSIETPEVQQREIGANLRQLESFLGRPVRSFSYPFGCRRDYTPQSVEIVRSLNFTCACSNFRGAIRPDTDPHQLPRFLVRDWPGDVFEDKFLAWKG